MKIADYHPRVAGYHARLVPPNDVRGYAWLRLVIDPDLRELLINEAEDQRLTLSEVVRRACRMYVARPHGGRGQ